MKKENQREIEVALAIYHNNPEQYIKEFAALTSIGRFRLIDGGIQLIRDIYFDTRGDELKKRGMALRLRKVGEKQLITLKCDSKPTGWGGYSRLEIEQPWSELALQTILTEIKNRKVNLTNYEKEGDFFDAIKILSSLGLCIIQERSNQRIIRNIVPNDGDFTMLAEMAIDSVTYQFHGQMIRFYEVEIESKSPEDIEVVAEVVQLVVDRYPSILKKWQHSKLFTGKAIEKLLEEGTLESFLDDRDNLKPGGYDEINRRLCVN